VTALIVGGAATVWDDLDAFRMLGVPADVVIAVNDIGTELDHVDYWVSLHADRLPGWERKRDGPRTWETWTHSDPYDLCDHVRPHRGGSSGAYGALVAIEELGATRVVLCGMPLLSRHTHYFEGQPFDEAGRFRKEWVENGLVDDWQGIVKSMSGWTREKMGAPTTEWLTGAIEEAA